MKAAILNESSKPLIVSNVDLPEKLQLGQVLVKVYYSGICGAQINEIDAVKGPDKTKRQVIFQLTPKLPCPSM